MCGPELEPAPRGTGLPYGSFFSLGLPFWPLFPFGLEPRFCLSPCWQAVVNAAQDVKESTLSPLWEGPESTWNPLGYRFLSGA